MDEIKKMITGNRNANFGQMKEFTSQSKANGQQILPKSSRIKYSGKLDCFLSKPNSG